ncbi:MAG: protoporphyrinogen oxidase HemJ [Porticoccaceae bacterium]
MSHDWIEVLHIISVICWFAALFYLPRLFVYHASAEDAVGIERFKIMERKLLRGIANPAMVATLVFGIWLASLAPDYYLHQAWFWVKVSMVSLLVIYHFACIYFMKQFRDDKNTRSHVFYRWFNEVPVVILIVVVIMVVIRPF